MNAMINTVESDLKGLQDMFRGSIEAFRPRKMYFFAGPKSAGKTSLSLQEASVIAKAMNKNVLYIHAEKDDFEFEAQKIAAHFGLGYINTLDLAKESELTSPSLIYHMIPPFSRKHLPSQIVTILYNLFDFFGEKAMLEISKTGNVKFHLASNPWVEVEDKLTGEKRKERVSPNECEKLIKNYNVGVIILDSISDPLKDVFVGIDNTKNRADCLNSLLYVVNSLTIQYGLFTFVIHHVRGVVDNRAKPSMYADDSMGYKAEIQFMMARFIGAKTLNFIRVTAVRLPLKEPWVHFAFFKHDEMVGGFRDITEDEGKLLNKKKDKTEDEPSSEEVILEESET